MRPLIQNALVPSMCLNEVDGAAAGGVLTAPPSTTCPGIMSPFY